MNDPLAHYESLSDEFELPDGAVHYLDGARGIYIPRDFFLETKPECINWHCDQDTKKFILESCADPDNEWYWEAWSDAEMYGQITVTMPDTGIEYRLYQDGDLWLIPVENDDG